MIPLTIDEAKALARSLRESLPDDFDLTHGQSLDLLSRTLGFADWNELAAQYKRPSLGPSMPVLRVFDVDLARSFYVDVLAFTVDFEHRFAPGLPVFLGISRGSASLGLSEHHGDGTPGAVVWVPTRNLADYLAHVTRSAAGKFRPGVDTDAPGGPTMTIADPFGNELRFCEPR